jgi:hypothetical protein
MEAALNAAHEKIIALEARAVAAEARALESEAANAALLSVHTTAIKTHSTLSLEHETQLEEMRVALKTAETNTRLKQEALDGVKLTVGGLEAAWASERAILEARAAEVYP